MIGTISNKAATAVQNAGIPLNMKSRYDIEIDDLDLENISQSAWEIVIQNNTPPSLFIKDNALVCIKQNMSDGSLFIKQVDRTDLRHFLAQYVNFVVRQQNKRMIVLAPSAVCDDMIEFIDPRIPALKQITQVPIFTSGGALIDTPGYHQQSGVYYDHTIDIPKVSDRPTYDEMVAVRSLIDDLIIDFGFVSKSDKAHWYALCIQLFCRNMIDGPTPLYPFTAPTAGSGKGMLSNIPLVILTGGEYSTSTLPYSDAELTKMMIDKLRKGIPAVLFDNVNRTIDSGVLANLLTARSSKERLLGLNEDATSEIRLAWIATGNNLSMSHEIARRSVPIAIDPKVMNPDLRPGSDFKHPQLIDFVKDNRSILVHAILTLIRYGIQNTPDVDYRPQNLGSYEKWSDVMGRILYNIGVRGFLENIIKFRDNANVESNMWTVIVSAWYSKFQCKDVITSHVFDEIKDTDINIKGDTESKQRAEFGRMVSSKRDTIIQVKLDDGSTLNAKITKHPEGKMRHKSSLWRLELAEAPKIGNNGHSNVPVDYTGPAIWRSKDYDHPINITGYEDLGDVGEFFTIEGSSTGIPYNEVVGV